MVRMTNTLATNMDVLLSDLKKRLEEQKSREEQERLRKIQVSFLITDDRTV